MALRVIRAFSFFSTVQLIYSILYYIYIYIYNIYIYIIPFLWLRYLDEIFGIWIQSSPKLKELFNCIISLHPTIKLTMGYSTIKTNWINFLGVTVAKSGDKLGTDLYCKSTDAQQPLYEHSCHRNMYEGSIAYGQVERFKRICSIKEILLTILSS